MREATLEDLPEMLAIYNDAILHLTATFDLEEQSIEDRKKWFLAHGGRNPLIVAEIDGVVAGYASLSPFRDKEAYKDTTEISIYISKDHRGLGIGKRLMEEILSQAADLNYHVIIAGITTGNEGSVHLHVKYGFEFIGRFKEVGYKFGEWQSVDFYQLILR
ncbi:GNAT family N-acetyltransferase [Chungangia koreensis]|uniref:GNAT family N-acetyltransferase n=1 Tax=Chungangia koreensis TaxID=752657 RepID=A0ABV8X269_9LACT